MINGVQYYDDDLIEEDGCESWYEILSFNKGHILNNHLFSVNAKIEKRFVQIIAPLPKLRDLLNQAQGQGYVMMIPP